ncbi:MAG: SdiA-regulated domain-containing protein [Bacteroidota bacterium]
MKKIFLISLLFFSFKNTPSLKIQSHKTLHIPEPSGICVTNDQHYFVASNNGEFCEIDKGGKLIRSEKLGMDIEDVCAIGTDLYVMDESLRLVYVLDEQTWKLKATHSINYNGARNKGFESITYLPEKKHFIVITEKQPLLLFETDENFNVLNQVNLIGISDLSSATYYNNKLWLLSDEDHTVLKVNTDDFSVEKKYNVPIYNPEGICFDTDGTMRIVSDDCRRLYTFQNPEKQ